MVPETNAGGKHVAVNDAHHEIAREFVVRPDAEYQEGACWQRLSGFRELDRFGKTKGFFLRGTTVVGCLEDEFVEVRGKRSPSLPAQAEEGLRR